MIHYSTKEKIPLKHIMIFISVALNKDINFMTNKINALLN
jgi:hypothetical protein